MKKLLHTAQTCCRSWRTVCRKTFLTAPLSSSFIARNDPAVFHKKHPVLPEAEKSWGKKVLCFYGEEEKYSLCRDLPHGLAIVIPLKGAHNFGGHYEAVTEMILSEAK